MGKDVNTPLRRAYVQAIKAMTYEGSNLVVYDKMIADTNMKGKEELLYCVVLDQTVNDSVRTKNVLSYDATIMINIYHQVMGSVTSKKVDDIGNLFLQAFLPVSGSGFLDLSASNLDIVTTGLVSDMTTSFSVTNYHKGVVRSMRFRHQISE